MGLYPQTGIGEDPAQRHGWIGQACTQTIFEPNMYLKNGDLPCPTLPCPALPCPTISYPTLPYPTLSYPTLTYPTLPTALREDHATSAEPPLKGCSL